jgi:hypothetical protein
MGAFDNATNTQLHVHVYTGEKGDYYDIDDGAPQFNTVLRCRISQDWSVRFHPIRTLAECLLSTQSGQSPVSLSALVWLLLQPVRHPVAN